MSHHDDDQPSSGTKSSGGDDQTQTFPEDVILSGEGKYLQLVVPEFGTDPISGNTMTSYLRIGAVPGADNRNTSGDDLFDDNFTGFADDTRYRGGSDPSPPVDVSNLTLDGGSSDDGGDGTAASQDPVYTTQTARQNETALLYESAPAPGATTVNARGGWRDHSDGNRITTTRGDKVEIIRGNYQMIVLGRQDNGGYGAQFDTSGGHTQDNNATPGAVTKIEWVKDLNGTWRVTEETWKGETVTRYMGRVREEFYGPSIDTIIGTEGGGDPVGSYTSVDSSDDHTDIAINPVVNETTFARSITSTTGSSGTPVGKINETTYADEIDSYTYAKTVSENFGEVGNSIENSYENRYINNHVSKSYGTATEMWFGNFSEVFTGGNESFRLAGSVECSIGIAAEMFIGLAFEIFVGKKIELLLGSSVELSFGSQVEVGFGRKVELHEMVDKASAKTGVKALMILLG